MSYNEKKSVTNIISGLTVSFVYALIVYQKYLNGTIDDSNIFKFWAVIILIFLPIAVISKVIFLVLFHVVESIKQKKHGRSIEDEIDIIDDRDKLIQMKSYASCVYIILAGFILALFTQLFDVSHHYFFIVLGMTGVVTDVVSELLIIRSYRRGV